ncbi:hypothetical protein [Hufsiella ginkgonis]|uniref:Lipocalin-like domain-containing protein n=1 Tax=Hufsiella ginkgonis TaxID=2695274 RepID=A0A7K1XZY2_9SPHI|nr:hypothetical protein [Hufsiella ginkgonis]MXV16358.1 hypothetical protein [Hufsiella ginkgonis]
MKKIALSFALVLFTAVMSFAAGIDGAWKGLVEGQYKITADLKTEGGKVSGVLALTDPNPKSENPDDAGYTPFVAAQMGKNTITEGKAEGEKVTFTTLFNEKPIVYTGTLTGDKLVLTTTYNNSPIKITLTRVVAK